MKSGSRSSEHPWAAAYRPAGLIIKLLVTAAALFFIYHRVLTAESELSFSAFFKGIQLNATMIVLLVLSGIMVVLNWGLEIVKWKVLVSSQFLLSWKRSVKGVLSGITFGLFTPNRIGELTGRVLTLEPQQRIDGALLSMVNGLSQTLATLTFGILGTSLLLQQFILVKIGFIPTMILQATVLLVLAFGLLLYYRIDVLSDVFLRMRFLQNYKQHIQVLRSIPASMLTKLYGLSLLRFTTFVAQYIVVFQFLMPGQPIREVLSASVMTLFSITLLPFVPVPDLLLRESFALGYFELYAFDPAGVSIVVFSVWLINVAAPSLIGAMILYTYRFFRGRS
jgi:hypothetical protein